MEARALLHRFPAVTRKRVEEHSVVRVVSKRKKVKQVRETWKLVSYNLRCTWDNDGINSFVHRAGQLLDKLDAEQPEVVCFQEATERIVPFLKRHLPDYELHFRGRNRELDGEGLCTALRKDFTELLDTETFWLSPTPYLPGSRFEQQSEFPRVCQSLTLRLQNGKPFRVYNTHLDHINDEARILGIRQVMNKVLEDRERSELPVFVLGDFNALPGSETVNFCDTFGEFPLKDLTRETGGTFHDFGRQDPPEKIDYIYTDEATARKQHSVVLWKDQHAGIYLSDH